MLLESCCTDELENSQLRESQAQAGGFMEDVKIDTGILLGNTCPWGFREEEYNRLNKVSKAMRAVNNMPGLVGGFDIYQYDR